MGDGLLRGEGEKGVYSTSEDCETGYLVGWRDGGKEGELRVERSSRFGHGEDDERQEWCM